MLARFLSLRSVSCVEIKLVQRALRVENRQNNIQRLAEVGCQGIAMTPMLGREDDYNMNKPKHTALQLQNRPRQDVRSWHQPGISFYPPAIA